MPLGATIVHELVTARGQRLKLAEPRAPGMQPRPAGTAVWLKPLSAASVSVFATP
jgi:putative spermidine/putrescine transport system ATP-binding protein